MAARLSGEYALHGTAVGLTLDPLAAVPYPGDGACVQDGTQQL